MQDTCRHLPLKPELVNQGTPKLVENNNEVKNGVYQRILQVTGQQGH